MRRVLLTGCLLLPLVASAAEADGEADPAPVPDPSLRIEASGEHHYRSRDLDALMLVARRHLGRELAAGEEAALRALIARILVTREPLLPLLERLPPELDGGVREHLILDLLAYRPQPVDTPEAAAPTQADRPPPADDEPQPPSTADGAQPPTPEAPPPVALDPDLILLPTIALARRDREGQTRRVTLELALRLGADDDRERVAGRLPLLQDAALMALHGLDLATLVPADPEAIKTALTPALRSAEPAFTGEVLVTSVGEAP